MSIMKTWRKQVEDDIKNFGYNVDQKMYGTGFMNFDYLNGSMDYKKGEEVLYTGIDAGKIIMVVGKAGCGKSTFALQMAGNIMQQFTESDLCIFDFEQSHTESRIKSVTGMSEEFYNDHVIIKKVGIYTETVLKYIKQLSKFKKDHEKELCATTSDNTMPPSFVLIDSLASMRTFDYQDGDTLNGLTSGGRNAINNKEFVNRILQPCMEANIIVIIINHLNTNMSMGVTPPEAQTRYLKNTEAVSGGAAVGYLCNLFIKVTAKDKLEEDKDFKIKGFKSEILIVKSRNAEAGRALPFIYNQKEGFDPELSMFEYMKSNGLIKGAGVGLYLEGLETTKFRMSNFKEKLATDPQFKSVFYAQCEEALKQSVKTSSKLKREEAEELLPAQDPIETLEPNGGELE